MKANVGDWLVMKGTTAELADQTSAARSPKVHGADGRRMWYCAADPLSRTRVVSPTF